MSLKQNKENIIDKLINIRYEINSLADNKNEEEQDKIMDIINNLNTLQDMITGL